MNFEHLYANGNPFLCAKMDDGSYAAIGMIEGAETVAVENPFGECFSLGLDLASNGSFTATAYLTDKEIRSLRKALGIRRKDLSDFRRRESAKRYRMRKLNKRRKK